ncbi:hypothetical protein MNBD_GAMMA21-1686 [hydrothermal vent metagenome]|uniref:Pyridoxamine 5'-phosphate oxidase N-terminal domain-containing protein n=1 Tax=hydrothermal vent metagenome TaxID=652676 RepID=A0A3B1A1R4_9ZZZZ
MAKVHPNITTELAEWIGRQPVFFTASAPLAEDSHINLSPRGLDSFRVINEHETIILDLTGSGNETAAHLTQNGRLTVMFCAFTGPPQILRLFGQGTVIRPGEQKWSEFRAQFADDLPGVRQIFHQQVTRVQTSCGFGVPLMKLESQRDLLPKWAMKRGEDGIQEYQKEKNATSIDGLPAPGLTNS